MTDIWPQTITLMFLAVLGAYAWRHRSVPGATPFAVSCLFSVIWLGGAIAETLAVAASAKSVLFLLQCACQLPAVTAMTCFALEYAGGSRWLTRRNVLLLAVPPALTLLLLLTNNWSHFLWVEFASDGLARFERGIGYWIIVAYAQGLGLVNLAVFAWLFIRSPKDRLPVALMAIGQIAGRGIYLLNVLNTDITLTADLVTPAILFPHVMYAIALFGFRIFDPLPAARTLVIEQMREGMVVVDRRWRVASLNPAAESILSAPKACARGRSLVDILPTLPDPDIRLAQPGADPHEIRIEKGGEAHYYTVDHSPLEDHRGLNIGHVLLLHDVTERHRAQAQMLTQQWAQATSQEREQLAHELHDGLSQNLAFLNLQAQTTQVYLQTQQEEAAQTSLDRLSEVARELQGDMREMIGNLLTVSQPSGGFATTLRQVIARFEEQNGQVVRFELDGVEELLLDPALLAPAAGVQVVRILQEALANVRKHGGSPSEISVSLAAEDGQLRMSIADNGVGFDPASRSDGGRHFGLQIMRQRAARIGGQFTLRSAPGQGTCVEVLVPLAIDERKDPA